MNRFKNMVFPSVLTLAMLILVVSAYITPGVAQVSAAACGSNCLVSRPLSPQHSPQLIGNLGGAVALSTTNVWAVGGSISSSGYAQSLTENWNGSMWNVVNSPNIVPAETLIGFTGVAVVSADDIWAVGYYFNTIYNSTEHAMIEHWNGKQWSVISSPQPQLNAYLAGVAAIAPNDVWAVGNYIGSPSSFFEHWDGASWTLIPNPVNQPTKLYAITATSATNVWAVGNGLNSKTQIEHWDGTNWSVATSPSPGDGGILNGVTAYSPSDIWAVGDYIPTNSNSTDTLIEHWNGSSWSVIPSPSPEKYENVFYAVTELSADNVWAVGDNANGRLAPYNTLIEHWDGAHWKLVKSPNNGKINSLYAVAGASANDIWAVGESGANNPFNTLIEHWDSSKWSIA